MASRKVLILESGLLPSATIHSLLSELKNVEIMTTRFTTVADVDQIIKSFRPHILIFDDPNLEATLALLSLFKATMVPRAIFIHWEKNVIEICDRYRVEVKELSSFLAML